MKTKTKQSVIRRLIKDCFSFIETPEQLQVWEWAEKRRMMPSSVTAKSGPYDLHWTPYMKDPQDAFFDPSVQVTVLCAASRTGKTETEMNLTGYTIDHDPCNILWVYPTLDSAKKWAKEFFNPMVEASPCFRGKISEPRSRDGDNTMLSKSFPGGRVTAIGANSPSGFRQIQAPRVICEEVDAMENTAEGDPVVLAFKRADNYSNSVQVVSSTPTIKGRSRIWAWLERSDFQKVHVKCPYCSHEYVLQWEQMIFKEDAPQDALLSCPSCAGLITDEQRQTMVRAYRWLPTQPFTGIRGYWANGMVSLFPAKKGFKNRLHQWAKEYLEAKAAGVEAMQVWINTFKAECYEEESLQIAPDLLSNRVEDYNNEIIPGGVLIITAGCDVQKDRLEIVITGWGVEEECWALRFVRLWGDPDGTELWRDLDQLLLSEFKHPSGSTLKITRAFVDAGFKPDRVFSYTGPRAGRGVFACRGYNKVGPSAPPILPSRPSTNNKGNVPCWWVGVTVAKKAIYDRLTLLPPGSRTIHFPLHNRSDSTQDNFGFDNAFFKQLTAERAKTRYSYGQPYVIFEKEKQSDRNEALDCCVYSLAAMYSLMPILWNKVKDSVEKMGAAELKKAAATDEAEPEKPEVKKPDPALQPIQTSPMRMTPRRGGSWVKSW